MAIDCILKRRSVRNYTDEPIDQATLELLLKAGMYAPSALNAQPWEFVVVQDKQTLEQLSNVCQYWGPVGRAPLGIVVCGHIGESYMEAFTLQDCSAATENILCAANALDLGGVWLGCYGVPERVEAVSKLLNLPTDVVAISVIALGHPKTPVVAHDEYYAQKVHYAKY